MDMHMMYTILKNRMKLLELGWQQRKNYIEEAINFAKVLFISLCYTLIIKQSIYNNNKWLNMERNNLRFYVNK